MSGARQFSLLALVALLALMASPGTARFVDSTDDEPEVMDDVRDERAVGEGEDLAPFQDPVLALLDSRSVPAVLSPSGALVTGADVGDADQYFIPSPLKRRNFSEEILKRSKLNLLIHRLLQMRGDRYSYHRASPVRFAGGRR